MLPPGQTWGTGIGPFPRSKDPLDRRRSHRQRSCMMPASSFSALHVCIKSHSTSRFRHGRGTRVPQASLFNHFMAYILPCLVRFCTVTRRKRHIIMHIFDPGPCVSQSSVFHLICSIQSATPASWIVFSSSKSIFCDPGTV